MKFWLLTHERELARPTNTGQLIEASHRILWARQSPAPALLDQIKQGSIALLYPDSASPDAASPDAVNHSKTAPDEHKPIKPSCAGFEHFVILDATWQEAQKMYNQSSYLHHLPKVSLQGYQSTYQLRRNQRGLCTAEVAAYIAQAQGKEAYCQALLQRLQQHQQLISGQNHHGN